MYLQLRRFLRVALLLLCGAVARCSESKTQSKPHVCIIGGGIAGAVTAHYLANDTTLTLFEANSRLGGRIASIQLAPNLRVEAGASILAAENRLFADLTAELGLSRKEPGSGGDKMRLGLWDGHAFRYASSERPWVDVYRMLWRYGTSLLWMRRYVSSLLTSFDELYEGAGIGFESVEQLLARAPGMYALTQEPFDKTAAGFGGGPLVEELISAVREKDA